MSVSGLCALCGTAPAIESCQQCGAMVCADHYLRGRGICQECAAAGNPD